MKAEASPESSLAARWTGVAEAEAMDLRLRLKESLERERLLVERALKAEWAREDAFRNEHDLRDQLDRWTAFKRDLDKSLPWRLVQGLRRLVGRQW